MGFYDKIANMGKFIVNNKSNNYSGGGGIASRLNGESILNKAYKNSTPIKLNAKADQTSAIK